MLPTVISDTERIKSGDSVIFFNFRPDRAREITRTFVDDDFTGFERKFAVRFAFLLSIPAVLGANILTLKDAIDAGIDFSSVPVYLVGVVVAAVSGYASIRLLRYVADKGRFGAFAYYCWAAGVLTLVLTILH